MHVIFATTLQKQKFQPIDNFDCIRKKASVHKDGTEAQRLLFM